MFARVSVLLSRLCPPELEHTRIIIAHTRIGQCLDVSSQFKAEACYSHHNPILGRPGRRLNIQNIPNIPNIAKLIPTTRSLQKTILIFRIFCLCEIFEILDFGPARASARKQYFNIRNIWNIRNIKIAAPGLHPNWGDQARV